MHSARGSLGSRQPLTAYLSGQLRARGHVDASSAERAKELTLATDAGTRASLLVDLGSCKFVEGDAPTALALWCRAIPTATVETASLALLNAGLLHEEKARYRQAVEVLFLVLDHGIVDHAADASLALARCQLLIEDHVGAMETLAALAETLILSAPGDPRLGQALLALGDVAAEVEHDSRAERAWRAAMACGDATTQGEAMQRLGVTDQTDVLIEMPITDEHALVGDKSRDLHTLELVDTHIKLGDRQAAIDLLCGMSGITLPTDQRFRYVDMMVSQGLVNGAIDELEVLLGSDAVVDQCRSAFTLGAIYHSHEMLTEAESMYRRVATGSNKAWSTKAADRLAHVLEEMGDDDAAIAWFELALTSADPEIRARAQGRLDAAQLDAAEADDPHVADEVVAKLAPLPVAVNDTIGVIVEGPQPEVGGSAPAAAVAIAAPASPTVESATTTKELDDEPIIELPAKVADPVVVVLSRGDVSKPAAQTAEQRSRPAAGAGTVAVASEPKVVDLREKSTRPPQGRAAPSPFTRMVLSRPNPYAALAPDDAVKPDVSIGQNPYAELAPNFADSSAPAAKAPEPAHWSALLEEWSDDERPGFFERFV